MHWSIQNKVVAVFSTVVVIIILLSLTTYRNAYNLIDANQREVHSHEVQEKLEAVLSLIKDAETGQRGFLLTGDEQYLEPYVMATTSLHQVIRNVEPMVADNPAQTEKITQLKPLVALKLLELDQTIRLRREEGLTAAQEIVRLGSGKESMDQIRRVIASMEGLENDLLRKRIHQVQRENNSTTFAIIVATLLNLLLLGLGYYAIIKHLRERRELEERIDLLNQRLDQSTAQTELMVPQHE